jgi:hypothetical protein
MDDREEATWNAFYEVFPKAIQDLLKPVEYRGLDQGDPALDDAEKADAFALAVPDGSERARLICRALGILDGDWFSYRPEERQVLLWANRLSPFVLVPAIDSFPDNSLMTRNVHTQGC